MAKRRITVWPLVASRWPRSRAAAARRSRRRRARAAPRRRPRPSRRPRAPTAATDTATDRANAASKCGCEMPGGTRVRVTLVVWLGANFACISGAAPGVGKTFAMLNEGRRRHERGTDVVVGLRRDPRAAPHRRAARRSRGRSPPAGSSTAAPSSRRWTSTRSSRASPRSALVDELAHTNIPGSGNEKRWQDVEQLLDAGIDVISTLNIQHLESVNDVVERITGVKQRETIPDEVVRRADQIELVDMTPEALRRRMAHGNIYKSERIDAALGELLPARATSPRSASSRCCGSPTGSTRGSRTTASSTASPSRGRRASGCSSRSPARPAPRR